MADEDHLKWLRIEANMRAQVRRERKREGKLQIAKAMVKKGYPIADIMLLTG